VPSVRPVTLGALAFDSVGADGLSWEVADVGGWDDGSPSTLTMLQKLRGPGGWRSSDPQMTSKPLALTGTMSGPDTATVVRGCSVLKAAATLDETTLTVNDPGYGVRTMRVARQGAVLLKPQGALANTFSVSLVAADPRKFGPTLAAPTALPSSTGGLTVPFTVPFAINATTVSGSVSLTNAGDIAGPVSLRIAGPVVAPIVTHRGPDGVATVFALSLTLAAGEFVVVDMEAETVLAQGQSSRARSISARGWQAFKPGVNTWFFSSGSYDPGALLTVTATPTWE